MAVPRRAHQLGLRLGDDQLAQALPGQLLGLVLDLLAAGPQGGKGGGNLQPLRLRRPLVAVRLVHLRQIGGDLEIHRRCCLLQALGRDHLLAARHGIDLGAVDRQHRAAHQRLLAAEPHERPAHAHDRLRMILAEVGHRLEGRRRTTGQPHHFDVALRFRRKPAARPHPVQVAVDIELQQIAGRVGRTAELLRDHLREAKLRQIQAVDEGIDHPHRIVAAHRLVERLRKQDHLLARLARLMRHGGVPSGHPSRHGLGFPP